MFDMSGPGAGSSRERLEWVLTQPPSAATHAALETLDPLELTSRERVQLAQAWDRQLSTVTAHQLAALDAATWSGDSRLSQEVLEAEVALALRRSDRALTYELQTARGLAGLPGMSKLLRAGEITLRHALVLVDLTAGLPADQAALVDARVATRATTMTVPGFRRVVRRAVAAVDTRTEEERRRRAARTTCGVKAYPQPDGLMTLAVTLPATDGVAALASLNAAADRLRVPDDQRSHGQRQAQAFTDAILGAAQTGGSADTATSTGTVARRRRTEIQVVIDWRSLLGLADHPGELLGYGPITATAVRELLEQEGSVLRRLVTDPLTGTVTDVGASTYRPDAGLRRFLAARDLTCRYPGCTRNAVWCDDEHCQPHDQGGATSAGNCCLMCRRHHRRKTHHGFRYSRPGPTTGETRWTTPLGFTYRQTPASYDDGPDPGDMEPGDMDPGDADPP